MIKVKNLNVSAEDKEILKGINLEIKPGEIHAIMGPNGSGKSTLSKVIAGHPDYQVTSGSISYEVDFEYKDLMEMEADERAKEGIFLGFQYPIDIPGISNFNFLKTSFEAICKHQGAQIPSDEDFKSILDSKLKLIHWNEDFLNRPVNDGFSGGEKKKNEILQMMLLNPRLALLDETDSGLDIDALKIVSEGVKHFHNKNNSILLVTHYQRLLEYVVPDFVHVLMEGKIVKTGDKDLAFELEKKGYDWVMG